MTAIITWTQASVESTIYPTHGFFRSYYFSKQTISTI